jgi:hypothetical protein
MPEVCCLVPAGPGQGLTVFRRARFSLFAVITEFDIWRAAYLMLRWYGDTAREESARRAEEFAVTEGPDVGSDGRSTQIGFDE